MIDEINKNVDVDSVTGERIEQQADVPAVDIGRRFDQVAAELFSDFSRVRLQQWIKQGHLLVDGQQQVPKYKLLGGEALRLSTELAPEGDWQAEDIPLDIVFEDDTILVINKSANFVVHPAAGNYSGTVLNALLYHCPSLISVPRAGIVHRLDKDTTGLMVVAKTLQAHTNLVAQLQARSVRREYEAVVTGVVIAGGTIDQPVGRHAKQRTKMAVISDGKEARTHYKVVDRFDGHSHLRLKLETGRTHQIRVHMAYKGNFLLGDQQYGKKNLKFKKINEDFENKLKLLNRQALHAKSLGFIHPTSNKNLNFETELPKDFKKLLDLLNKLSN